jgi:hypothetical protein
MFTNRLRMTIRRLRGDARALGRNRFGICVGEVAHDLPANRWIGIEEPFDVGDPAAGGVVT